MKIIIRSLCTGIVVMTSACSNNEVAPPASPVLAASYIDDHSKLKNLKGRTRESIESEFGPPEFYGYDRYPFLDHFIPDSFYTIRYARYPMRNGDIADIRYGQDHESLTVEAITVFPIHSQGPVYFTPQVINP